MVSFTVLEIVAKKKNEKKKILKFQKTFVSMRLARYRCQRGQSHRDKWFFFFFLNFLFIFAIHVFLLCYFVL